MGKGQFIMTLAKKYPHINYIGMERYTSVLFRALQKMEQEPPEKFEISLRRRHSSSGILCSRRNRPYLSELLRSLAKRPPRQTTFDLSNLFVLLSAGFIPFGPY